MMILSLVMASPSEFRLGPGASGSQGVRLSESDGRSLDTMIMMAPWPLTLSPTGLKRTMILLA